MPTPVEVIPTLLGVIHGGLLAGQTGSKVARKPGVPLRNCRPRRRPPRTPFANRFLDEPSDLFPLQGTERRGVSAHGLDPAIDPVHRIGEPLPPKPILQD